MSYIVLRGRRCNIVLNAHAPTEEKNDDLKDGFCKELEQVSVDGRIILKWIFERLDGEV
jgi:hypothetical protein